MNVKAFLETHKAKLNRLKGEKERLEKQRDVLKERQEEVTKTIYNTDKALEIVKQVGLSTQYNLQVHISDLTTMALDTVFDGEYVLKAEFVERRNKAECDLFLLDGDARIDPMSATGGGVVDVCSFALRVAAWTMQRPHYRNVMLLDEPFTHLSKALYPKAGDLLSQLSHDLGIQIIMVTHSPELIECADKVFTIQKRNGVSQVKEVVNE